MFSIGSEMFLKCVFLFWISNYVIYGVLVLNSYSVFIMRLVRFDRLLGTFDYTVRCMD